MKTLSLLMTLSLLVGCQAKAQDKFDQPMNLLFILHSKGGSYSQGRLTLNDVSKAVSYFSDRPIRKGGTMDVRKFLEGWSKEKKNNFTDNPPNAGVVSFDGVGKKYSEVPVELQSPEYDPASKTLSFEIKFLSDVMLQEGSQLEEVSIFVDSLWDSLFGTTSSAVRTK